MDKNTITGLVLIGILLVGFSFLSRPSEEQIAAQKKYYDSIALEQCSGNHFCNKRRTCIFSYTERVHGTG